ncbi:Cilia- and flagella-associated protein 36 [Dermatophagoides pteronyssinus]|uniref:Cilia- and flagella-associated protein 36 n=1 Tax=Dermatophagoides pteronyssinus TaxID=6956 RepID=A0ABQ8JD94_DERPT|nr:Cilia- and flagella-associated protein 36 [Dermatophagoides pteronyssinus]
MSTEDTEKDEDQSWVLDSLVGFLKSPLWSTSLNDFIDRHSIIFDPNEIEDDNGNVQYQQEYLEIFQQYRRLVDQLIGSHMQELDINEQQFSRACQLAEGMLATKLKRILFEELWAAEDYEVFVRLMSKRNVELQLEAMEIFVRKYGLVYDVFVPVGTSPKNFLSEDHILREAIVRSLNDLELEHDKDDDANDESKPNRGKVIRKNVEVDVEPNDNPPVEEESGEIDDEAEEEEEAAVVKTDKETVQRDAERLVKVKQKFDQKMTEALQSAFMNDDDDDDDGDKEKVKSQVQLTQIDEDGDDESESKAKQQPKDSSSLISTKPGLSDEDIHKRADYLRAQRDKILKKRQKERTERISKYLIKERQSKQPPPSVSLSSTGEIAESDATTTTTDNNGRMLAFRKSLAARLKAEVVLGGGGVANPTSKSSNE